MTQGVNVVRNPRLKSGAAGPRGWSWTAASENVRWERSTSAEDATPAGLRIVTDDKPATAAWTQTVRCKAGNHYRVEAVIRCDLAAADESCGFVLRIQGMNDNRPIGRPLTTSGIHRATDPVTVRAIFQAPGDTHSAEISLGLENAVGWVELIEARFITILEPDEVSHVLATPPSPVTVSVPRRTRNVCVCTADADQRPIVGLLRTCLGADHVRTVSPSSFLANEVSADALLLPDATPPKSMRSLRALSNLAAERIVIISLPAFTKLTGSALNLRCIEQEDDPICAKIVFANHASRGFALHDIFAFSWEGKAGGSYVQHQFRTTPPFRAFCRRNGFDVLLHSMCDRDATSEQPIALYKVTEGGGLYVLDVEPAEATGSTRGEPGLGMHRLLSILGVSHVGLGQYIVPDFEEADFRGQIREMGDRFQPFVVHDADVPTAEVTEQLVTIGRDDQSFGVPLTPKPVILIRSGLVSGDMESAYSAFLWVKQLVMPPPHACPYIESLASRFRLAWIPCAARWEANDGWRRSGDPPPTEFSLDVEGNLVAALIDLVSCPVNRVRIVVPSDDRRFDRYRLWLPQLADAFPSGRYFASGVGEGEQFEDRDRFTYQFVRPDLEVVTEPGGFDNAVHRSVLDAGGDAIRIEIPSCDSDFVAHSIQRTDIGATTLEHVVGLQFGLIAVNRRPSPARLDGFTPVRSGEALMIDRNDPVLSMDASQAG